MVESVYKNNLRANFTPGKTLPKISTKLDSVRAFQFEVRFYGVPVAGVNTDLTSAAKQVSPVGMTIEDIVVDRGNDRLFYPGKATPEELTITFDNQLLSQTTPALWEWITSIYDPITGDMTKLAAPGGAGNKSFKANKLTIMQLDNTNEPFAYLEVYGVYPKSFKSSEWNYSTNEFSTVEVTFRFDSMDYGRYGQTS